MKEIYVYCNASMVGLLKPLEVSKLLDNGYDFECSALYDYDKLKKITEDDCNKRDAWWREIGKSNITFEIMDKYQPRIMRNYGLLNYICDTWGASQPRNVSAIIGDICRIENKNPIEFFNSLKKL